MGRDIPQSLAHHIRSLAGLWQAELRPDGELLTAFTADRDGAAFTALVVRHGHGVWVTCRRVLGNDADAEDAFQATFIVLARKATQVRPESLGGWLQKVASDVSRDALKAARRRTNAHRRLYERATENKGDALPDDEIAGIVREEVAQLQVGLRLPLALYYLDGKTQAEIGQLLGITDRAVAARLKRGLSELHTRLASRGVTVTVGTIVAVLGQVPNVGAIPSGLVVAAARSAVGSLAGNLPVTAPEQLAQAAITAGRWRVKLWIGLAFALAGVAGGIASLLPDRPLPESGVPVAVTLAPGANAPLTDQFGDPLPPGAVARIGTIRFRTGVLGDAPGFAIGLNATINRVAFNESNANVGGVAFGPGGKWIASAHRSNTLHVWDADTGRELRKVAGPRTCASVSSTPNGNRFVAAGPFEIWCYDATGDIPHVQWKVPTKSAGLLFSAEVSPNGRLVASGSDGGDEISLLDATDGSVIRTLPASGSRFAFSPDGSLLASWPWTRSGSVAIWDVATGRLQITLSVGDGKRPVISAAFSPDGKAIATASEDQTLRLWDTIDGTERLLARDTGSTPFVAFTADGKVLMEFGGGRVRYWDAVTGKVARPTTRTSDSPGAAAYRLSPDGTRLAVALPSGVRLLDPASGREFGSVAGMPDRSVRAIAFSRDGSTVATSSDPAGVAVHLWNPRDGRLIRRLEPRSGRTLHSLAFGDEGVIDAALDRLRYPARSPISMTRWDTRAGAELATLDLPTETVCVAFAPDGRHLAAVGTVGVTVRDRVTGQVVRALPSRGVADAACYSADGNTLAAVYPASARVAVWSLADGTVRNWSPAGFDPTKGSTFRPSLALSTDGRYFAAGTVSPQGKTWVVEVATGAVVATLDWGQHGWWPHEMAFSPDARTLATGGEDGVLRIWEVASGMERRRFPGHRGSIYTVAFSPDGSRVVSGSDDCTALVWDATP